MTSEHSEPPKYQEPPKYSEYPQEYTVVKCTGEPDGDNIDVYPQEYIPLYPQEYPQVECSDEPDGDNITTDRTTETTYQRESAWLVSALMLGCSLLFPPKAGIIFIGASVVFLTASLV